MSSLLFGNIPYAPTIYLPWLNPWSVYNCANCGGTVKNVLFINQLSLFCRKFKLLPVPKIKILSALWLSYFKNSSPVLVTVKRCEISNKVSLLSEIGLYAAWVARYLLASRRLVFILGSFAKTLLVTQAIFAAMMLLLDAFVSIAARFIADLDFSPKTFSGSGAWVCSPDCLKKILLIQNNRFHFVFYHIPINYCHFRVFYSNGT